MAVPTGTFSRHSAIGARESLEDVIYEISPTDTPFLSNVKRGKARAVTEEWQTDSLASASDSNAKIEGDDAATDTAAPTTRFGNYTQISTKTPRVTGTLRALDTAGRRDELSYQIAKRGRELKRDMESVLCKTSAGSAGGSATAREMAGIGSWLWTNNYETGASSTTPTVTSGVPTTDPTAGTALTFSEAMLKSVIKQCWDSGGDPTLVLTGSFNKQLASAFGGIASQYRENPQVGPATIIAAADVYVSDFGQHQIVASRFTPATNVYVLDLEYWEVAYLRPMQTVELAKTGDSDQRMLLAEYTLKALQPDASGKVYTTTSS
jgi:hypothetical protein